MFIPLGRMAIKLLRDKDVNSTGVDDLVANQLEAALNSLEQYLSS